MMSKLNEWPWKQSCFALFLKPSPHYFLVCSVIVENPDVAWSGGKVRETWPLFPSNCF